MNRARIVRAVRSAAKKRSFSLFRFVEFFVFLFLVIVYINQLIADRQDKVIMLNTAGVEKESESNLTTDFVVEGNSNLYFSEERVIQVLDNWAQNLTTDDVKEGNTNLYFTTSRARNSFYGDYPIIYDKLTGEISLAQKSLDPNYLKSSNNPIADYVLSFDAVTHSFKWVVQKDILSSLSCTSGQVVKWDGSNWVCAEDISSTTNYTAGKGLQLNSNEFSINAPTCSGTDKLQWDGTQFVCAPDQDTTYTAGGTLLQLVGTQFSIREGTLTNGYLCTYSSTDGLVCNIAPNSVGTDSQTLSWDAANNQLSISNGNTVDLSDLQQTLNFNNTTGELSISEGNTVDLSTFWDNTDNQTLSLTGNTLSISGGNSVTFTNWDTDVTDDVKNLTDLQDVTITSPTTAQVLRYNGTEWVNSLLNFTDISDIDTSGATLGQVLRFDGSTWRPYSLKLVDLFDTPNDYGSAGQVLSTDGSGTVSWVDATSLGYWQKNGTSLSPKTAGDDILLNSGETLTISDFTKGGLIFAGDNGLLTQDASNLYWDIDNSRLGIGTTTPQASLHVMGGEIWLFNDGNNPRFVIGDNGNTGEYGWLQWDSANNYFRIDTSNSSATGLKVADNTLAIGNIYPASDSVLILANDSTEVFRVYDNGNIKTTLAGNSAVYTDSNGILTTTVPTSGTLGYWQRSGTNLTPSNAGDNLIIDGTTTLNGDVNISGSIVSNILPQNASLYDIGSSSTPWQNVFADNLHGNLQTNLTAGSVTFIDSSGNLAENNSQLYWDATNNRLGIGTNSPSTKLQVVGQTRSSSFAAANGTASTPAYRFYNDANTGLFLPAVDNLAFATGGIERLRIDSTGQVGINTTTPQANLEVNGTLIVRDISTFYNDLLIRSSSNYPLEVDYGDGSDGDVNITSADTVVNVYSYVIDTNLNSGATTVHVEDTSNFNNNDLVLIIQMQDYNNPSNVGVYEFKRVTVVDATTLQLNAGLDHSYTSGADNTTNAQVTQVIRVPEYSNLTIDDGASITAQAWDGKTGGIVVFKVLNTLTFNGTGKVDVTAKGYRGGSCNGCGNNAWGQQGEGITGLGQNSLSKNANGGGGGYGPSGYNGEPGAGGGCGTPGKDGVSSYTAEGGDAVCTPDKLIMGGGAGAGGDDDNRTPLPQYVDGAGAVLIAAKNISNATIIARGEDGIAPGGAGGTTGGGAGGTVKLYFTNYTENLIDVSGGKGGVDGDDTGGDGGDGLIVKKFQELSSYLLYADVANGFVGIRKSNPEYELDVGGTVRAVNYLTFSDKRLKTNIHTFANDTLLKLQKINPVIYKLKISNDSRYKYGLIAQQVEKYFPELVYKDKQGILAIDYQGFIAPLLKGIQELYKKVSQIETRLDKLEKMIKTSGIDTKAEGESGTEAQNSLFDKLNRELQQLKTKIETRHLVSKTVRTEMLQVDKDFIVKKDIAGSVILKAGQTQIEVNSNAVNENSLILITEEITENDIDKFDFVPYILIKQDKKFIIKVSKGNDFDIKFNYLILNTVLEQGNQCEASVNADANVSCNSN